MFGNQIFGRILGIPLRYLCQERKLVNIMICINTPNIEILPKTFLAACYMFILVRMYSMTSGFDASPILCDATPVHDETLNVCHKFPQSHKKHTDERAYHLLKTTNTKIFFFTDILNKCLCDYFLPHNLQL